MKKCKFCKGSGKTVVAHYQGELIKSPCRKCNGRGVR